MTEENSIINKKGRTHIGRFYKWYLLVVILISVAVFASMLVPKAVAAYGKYVGQTPEEAVQKYLEEEYPDYADGYTPLLIEQYDEFTVILYELAGDCPGQTVYYQLVRHNIAGWYINELNGQGSTIGIGPRRELGSYIAWNIGTTYRPDYNLVCGKTISDDVASVEVDFPDSGQTKRVNVKDGWFLILLESKDLTRPEVLDLIHAIRVLDADGVVLGEWDWSD